MPRKKKVPVPPVEHRAPDQAAAQGAAFAAGVLPDADRREPDLVAPVSPPAPVPIADAGAVFARDKANAPVFVADAGAAFQRDRSGDSRSAEKTEGQANFSTMRQRAEEAVAAAKAGTE